MHDIIERTYQIPYPSAGTEPLIQRIEYINEQEGIDVLIPNFDAELYVFMKSEEKLKKLGIHTFLPTIKQFEERQKASLSQYGHKYDIRVPYSKAIFSPADIYGLSNDFIYPLLVDLII